jgi:hypothetical protein
MNRVFFFLMVTVAAVSCGQFESHAIGQMDSVFYTPPYVRAGEFSIHKAQPYQMSSSFESKFVPLSSKEVGNLSQFTIPSLSTSASIPPSNLIFPSNANASSPAPNAQPRPISIVAPQSLPVQPQLTAQRAVVRPPQVARRPSSRRLVLQYQASTIPALNIKDGKSIQLTSASFPSRSVSQVAYQPVGSSGSSNVQQTAVQQSTLGLAPPRVSTVPVIAPATSSNLQTTVCCLPPNAYQNVVGTSKDQSVAVRLQNMPPGTYVGRGLIGQPAAYVDGQPLRNLIRYISF